MPRWRGASTPGRGRCMNKRGRCTRRWARSWGRANCIQSLGDIALRKGDETTAAANFREALTLYRGIAEPYSIGLALRRLARLERDAGRRREMLAEAVEGGHGWGLTAWWRNCERSFRGSVRKHLRVRSCARKNGD